MSISNCSANVINSLLNSGKYTYTSAKVRLCDIEILTMLNIPTKPSELLKCSFPTWYLNNHKKASVLRFSTAQFAYPWLTVLNHSLGGFPSMYMLEWCLQGLKYLPGVSTPLPSSLESSKREKELSSLSQRATGSKLPIVFPYLYHLQKINSN